MELRRYLFEHDMTMDQFAANIGTTRSHISNIINEKIRPSIKMCWRIAKATNGEVKLAHKKLLEKNDY